MTFPGAPGFSSSGGTFIGFGKIPTFRSKPPTLHETCMQVYLNNLGSRSRSGMTAEEAREAWRNTPSGSDAEATALETWRRSCSTPEEHREVWRKAPDGSEAETRAMRDWLASCTTAGEADEVYQKAPRGSTIEAEAKAKRNSLRSDD